MTPFEAKQWKERFVEFESKIPELRAGPYGYTPSIVRDSLEATDMGINHPFFKAVKQVLEEKGTSPLRKLAVLHAIFYQITRGFSLEIAKKKARIILSQKNNNEFWNDYVKREHKTILQKGL